ncbi:MAG: hypothetical protein KF716_14595 [Anaerolineae bacterium]|nr:hypothetical protein [Anaerolineae bacterium]
MPTVPEVTTFTEKFPSRQITSLVIDAQALGNLTIYGDAHSESRIVCSGDGYLLPDHIELCEGELHIDCHNMHNFVKHGQQQHIEIVAHVPTYTAIFVRMTSGAIALHGIVGDLDVQGEVGDITGDIDAEHVRIRLWVGEVILNQLHKDADIQIGLGSITLGWDELYGTEHINARCMFGGIDLRLPFTHKRELHEAGNFFKHKWVETPAGSSIQANTGFGGLDLVPVEAAHIPVASHVQ